MVCQLDSRNVFSKRFSKRFSKNFLTKKVEPMPNHHLAKGSGSCGAAQKPLLERKGVSGGGKFLKFLRDLLRLKV